MTRVIVCQVGRRPIVKELPADRDGGHLHGMQRIVGGLVDRISLDDGLDLWLNDEGRLLDLPLNRVIPTVVPAMPPGFDFIMMDEGLALPGEPGEWRIHGDFLLARSTDMGELAPVTDVDVARYQRMFSTEDPEAAELMDTIRSSLLHRG